MKKRGIKQNIILVLSKTFRMYFASYFFIFLGITLIILSFGSTIYSEYHYYLDQILRTKYTLETKTSSIKKPSNLFDELINGQQIGLQPAGKDSIVIEKIGVSAPVIWNVSVVNEEEYFEALKKGVAHAKGKAMPGQVGNVYLFAHSSIEFWKMGPYATVFNQIRRLEVGDKIHLFYKGARFDYEIFEKQTVPGFDLTPYDAKYDESVLTLQTCDPPGTQLNRLIIKARLVLSR